ncbi:hypothetical protein HCN44_004794 [Aphidius gifuensis]|uniref:Uncharacterized protein n=1 Tax=Aphidius gifuensis TaxID=684658 RepID=A0A835CNC0_APHGI|nr:hypothetical protein HCN44_004794 [Aphidius gifuensis]
MDHVTKSHPLIPNVSTAPDEDTVEVKSNTNAASQTLSIQPTTNNEINAMPDCEISQNLILVDKICSNKTTQLELTNNHDNNNVSFKINTSTYDKMLSHFQENQFSKAEQVMTELYADPIIPRSLVQKVSLKFQEFYHQSIDDLKKYLEGLFTDDEKVNCAINLFKKSFNKINTEHKAMMHLEKRGVLIKPEIKLVKTVLQLRRINLRKTYKKVKINIITVPMKKLLKQFLELPNVFQTIKEYMDEKETELYSSPSIVSSMLHGENWRKIKSKYSDKLVLPLSIYTDDYEINNPLRSHKCLRKMTGIYYSISCLPSEFAGQLKNWFLAQKHKQQDYNCFHTSANKKFFNNLSEEIKELQKEGIVVSVNGQKYHIFFHLAQLLGDNLALNQILGFNSTFNATYYCRICRASKKVYRQQLVENARLLRTQTNYPKDVASLSHGVKEKSVFFDVFNMFDSPTMDPFHDKEEGGYRYIMREVLYDLIYKKKYFTINYLNERISGYNIDKSSGVNIPPPITTNIKQLKKKYFILSGSEMSWLVMNLSILVSHLIDPDDKTWKLYIMTRKINCIIMSSSFNKETRPKELTKLIKDHHSYHHLYLQLFNTHLVPKLHFWLHIPRNMIKHGSIRGLSTIRGEAKHRFFKQVARSITSRKCPAYTLSVKHRLQWAHRILIQEPMLTSIVVGVKNTIYLDTIDDWSEFRDCTPINLKNPHSVYSWVNKRQLQQTMLPHIKPNQDNPYT